MRVKIKLFIYIIMQGNFSSRFSRIPKNKISIGYCWKKKCLFRSLYLNSVIKSEILEELFHLYCMHEKEASKDDGILNIPCMIVLTVPIRRNKSSAALWAPMDVKRVFHNCVDSIHGLGNLRSLADKTWSYLSYKHYASMFLFLYVFTHARVDT